MSSHPTSTSIAIATKSAIIFRATPIYSQTRKYHATLNRLDPGAHTARTLGQQLDLKMIEDERHLLIRERLAALSESDYQHVEKDRKSVV